MKTLNPCTSRVFLINPSPCGTTSSAGTPRTFKATLSRSDAVASINVPVVVLPTGQLQLTLPDPYPVRGIWQLTVGDSQCNCTSERVFIDACSPMSNVPTHTATGDGQSTSTTPVTVCCD